LYLGKVRDSKRDSGMTKFEVCVGTEFEVSAVEVGSIETVLALSAVSSTHRTLRMRENLTVFAMVVLGISLLVATLIGLFDGSFNEVNAVWTAGGVPLGFVLRTYFEKG
jgi:hypothetical protein